MGSAVSECEIATYACTEVIRAKHHAIMVQTNLRTKRANFLTHRLERTNTSPIEMG